MCDKPVTKKNLSEEEVRSRFLEHNVHFSHTKLYKDGSESGTGVGCAVIHKDTVYVPKLPDYASVFTAELIAVATALDQVFSSSNSNFVIYCDSRSTLEAIKKFSSFHPLVQKVQEWLFWISCRHKSLHFCWVPSHVGIHENEVSNREAIIAAHSVDITFNRVLPSDLKGPIRSYVLGKWQERWASPLLANYKKYRVLGTTLHLGIPPFILMGGSKSF